MFKNLRFFQSDGTALCRLEREADVKCRQRKCDVFYDNIVLLVRCQTSLLILYVSSITLL